MRILVVGSGGREHALVRAFQREGGHDLWVWPGNPAWFRGAPFPKAEASDAAGLADWCGRTGVDLCVVGPEQPLVEGLADRLRERGVRVFGPGADGARIEGSKRWAKAFMVRCGVPTAGHRSFTDPSEALGYVESLERFPVVVKADGLAAGKGVMVCADRAEALAAVRAMMQERRFGAAGDCVVVEEFLEGEEVSLMAFTDGRTVVPMVPAQDHKRVGEGDTGPNTGGMGAYAPAPVLPSERVAEVADRVLRPVVEGFRREGIDYRGVLYAGLMMTAEGPKVLEFNCRFGDPETQVVLALLDSRLSEVCLACAEGRLDGVAVSWRSGAAACVVLASRGYPGEYEKGHRIRGLDRVPEGVEVLHAGTALKDGEVVTAGGRVLNLVAAGPDLRSALERVYEAAGVVSFEGMVYRRDIGRRALARF